MEGKGESNQSSLCNQGKLQSAFRTDHLLSSPPLLQQEMGGRRISQRRDSVSEWLQQLRSNLAIFMKNFTNNYRPLPLILQVQNHLKFQAELRFGIGTSRDGKSYCKWAIWLFLWRECSVLDVLFVLWRQNQLNLWPGHRKVHQQG